jgi:hypothetical protein
MNRLMLLLLLWILRFSRFHRFSLINLEGGDSRVIKGDMSSIRVYSRFRVEYLRII